MNKPDTPAPATTTRNFRSAIFPHLIPAAICSPQQIITLRHAGTPLMSFLP
jgi:hypothetical protein